MPNIQLNAASVPHSPDHSLVSDTSQPASPKQTSRLQNQAELRTALQNDLGLQRYTQLEPLLDQIDSHETQDFNTLHDQAEAFVSQYLQEPALITKVLSYINTQAMLMGTLETNIQAHVNKAKGTLPQGVEAFVQKAKANSQDITQALQKLKVSPVFTAHPTNLTKPAASELVYRSPSIKSNASLQSTLSLSQSSGSLPSGTQSPVKGLAHAASVSNLGELPADLWKKQGRREVRPTVIEEAETYQLPLRNVQKAAHQIHKEVDAKLASLTGLHLQEPLIKTGNWVGGDRDGNCYVTADTLKASVAHYADTTLGRYAHTLGDSKLGSSKEPTNANLRTLAHLAKQDQSIAEIQSKIELTRGQYQSLLENRIGSPKMNANLNGGYANTGELIADLQALDFSALPCHLQERAQTKIRHLIMDIKANGFHGVTTDIRQNSAINEKTVDILMRLSGIRSDYRHLPESEKREALQAILNSPDLAVLNDDLMATDADTRSAILKDYKPHEVEDFQREVELIRAYKEIHAQFGKEALENCITANTETVSDLMEVMVLLRHAQVAGQDFCDMKIVGLIETVDDLKNGPEILDGLLSDAWYKEVLRNNDNRQMVMVGYSDSDRLAGSLASNWAVYKGTLEMMDIGARHGVQLEFFHGRGGTEARGAGRDYSDEISVHDGRSLLAGFRQTEQGEEVNAKFGNVEIANASLDQMLGATLDRVAKGGDQAQLEQFRSIADELAEHAESSYKSLYEHPHLAKFYESSTPISFVKHSNAGSRPPKRADPNAAPKALNINELRAIPWVGCWMQSRAMVPAFYGTGTAIENFLNSGSGDRHLAGKIESLRKMYQTWPFFRNLVDRTELALAKADMAVARQYAGPSRENQAIMDQIETEYEKTAAHINTIKEQSQLLQHRPTEKSSLDARSPLLRWSNAIQSNLLKQSQTNPEATQQLTEPMVVSMQAVANGYGRFG